MNSLGKTDLAREYRDRFDKEFKKDFPNGFPILKLARIMYKENNILFKDVENARDVLRGIEGKKNKTYRVTHRTPNRPLNPYKLPESDNISYIPYKLAAKRVLILSDIHFPYHSVESIKATFDYAKKEKPDCILLNGDILDFYALSKFDKDPKKRSFATELNMFKDFFQILQKTFGVQIVFKTGNHEERYQKFLWMKAKELDGVEEFDLENIIKARAEGIKIVMDKRIIKAGNLNIIHGHEFSTGFFSPVNPARGLYLKGKRSAIQGHNHQSSEHTEKDMDGKITTTWSTGCLCDLHPEYMPINKWNSGFAIVDISGSEYEVRNKRIDNGKVL